MANIPGAVSVPQHQPGIPQQLLLALAGAAPQMLMQFLGQRQQTQDQEAQGQAATGVLAELVRQGTLSPELFQSVGGQYTPGTAGIEGKTVAGVTAPNGMQTPTLSMQSRPAAPPQVNTSGINSRVAPQLLQQVLGTQESLARTDAAKASTDASIAGNEREAARQPLLLQQIQEGIMSEQFNRNYQAGQLAIQSKVAKTSASNDAARIGLERDRVGLERAQALQGVQANLSAIHADQFARFTNLAQLYASGGLDAGAARARASADVFHSTKPPTLEQFLSANLEKATAGILTGGDNPGVSILKTMFGDRPDVEYGSSIGLQPEQIEFLNQQLAVAKGDGNAVLTTASKTLPLQGDAKASELAKQALYLAFKTGVKVNLPAGKESGNIRKALAALLQGSTMIQAPASAILGKQK